MSPLKKEIFMLSWPFVFIGIFLYAYQTKEAGAIVISFIALFVFLIRWAQLHKQEKLSAKIQPKKEKLEITLSSKERKILRFQLLFFILSVVLILYPSTMILSPEKYTIYFYLGGWLLSVVSSVLFVCILNWKRLFAVLTIALFFPLMWFFTCALGVAFSSKQISDSSVSNGFLIEMLLGCIIYFGLILKAEGILEDKTSPDKGVVSEAADKSKLKSKKLRK